MRNYELQDIHPVTYLNMIQTLAAKPLSRVENHNFGKIGKGLESICTEEEIENLIPYLDFVDDSLGYIEYIETMWETLNSYINEEALASLVVALLQVQPEDNIPSCNSLLENKRNIPDGYVHIDICRYLFNIVFYKLKAKETKGKEETQNVSTEQ